MKTPPLKNCWLEPVVGTKPTRYRTQTHKVPHAHPHGINAMLWTITDIQVYDDLGPHRLPVISKVKVSTKRHSWIHSSSSDTINSVSMMRWSTSTLNTMVVRFQSHHRSALEISFIHMTDLEAMPSGTTLMVV